MRKREKEMWGEEVNSALGNLKGGGVRALICCHQQHAHRQIRCRMTHDTIISLHNIVFTFSL